MKGSESLSGRAWGVLGGEQEGREHSGPGPGVLRGGEGGSAPRSPGASSREQLGDTEEFHWERDLIRLVLEGTSSSKISERGPHWSPGPHPGADTTREDLWGGRPAAPSTSRSVSLV